MDSMTPLPDGKVPSGAEVVLLLQSAGGDYFKTANRVLAAQASGFEFSNSAPTTLALLSRDTREDIATMHVDGFKEATAELSSIVVRMSPSACPIECQAGTRLTTAIEKFARLMNARICDADARNLTEEEFLALGKRIDALMLDRRMDDHKEYARTAMPDGTVRFEVEGLSFVTEYRTPRGRHLRTDYFDVPPLTWYDGQIRGLQVAAELLEFMRTHHTDRYWYCDVIMAAVQATSREDYSTEKPTRGSAARAFLSVIVGNTLFAARNSSFGPWIAQQIEEKRHSKATIEEADAEQKRAFVERMKTARARKAQERAKVAEKRTARVTPIRQTARKAELVAA